MRWTERPPSSTPRTISSKPLSSELLARITLMFWPMTAAPAWITSRARRLMKVTRRRRSTMMIISGID